MSPEQLIEYRDSEETLPTDEENEDSTSDLNQANDMTDINGDMIEINND